jgi:hypothetical protein
MARGHRDRSHDGGAAAAGTSAAPSPQGLLGELGGSSEVAPGKVRQRGFPPRWPVDARGRRWQWAATTGGLRWSTTAGSYSTRQGG